MTHSCHNDYSRIGSIGRLINYIQKTETSFALQWRAAPFGVTSYEAGRLQRKRALKSFLLGVLITSSMRLFLLLETNGEFFMGNEWFLWEINMMVLWETNVNNTHNLIHKYE